jgi:hypothetical protein
LLDTEGRWVSRADLAVERALVVSIRCNHGPFVIHVRDGLAALARESTARGAAFVGINANDAREKTALRAGCADLPAFVRCQSNLYRAAGARGAPAARYKLLWHRTNAGEFSRYCAEDRAR